MKYLLIVLVITLSSTVRGQSASVEESINKGNAYYKQSEFDLAEKQYRQVLKKTPDNETARYNLANTLYRQKRYDDAEQILTKLSAKGENKNLRSSSYYNTGVLYSRQKDLEESIDAYKNALRLNPEDKEARENLQKALLELKQKQQQQKKDQQEANKKQSRINPNEAERKLEELEEKEKQLQQRMQSQKGGTPMPKDW
jgi:Ca-activated chloride channel family protein